MARINDLKSALTRQGITEANRFTVDLSSLMTLPFVNDTELVRDLQVLATAVELPNRQLFTTPSALITNLIEHPTGFTNGDLTITFYCGNYDTKRLFDKWVDYIVDPKSYLVRYPDEFKRDLVIKQLDDTDKVVYSAKIIGGYPKSIGGVAFNSGSEEITSFVVQIFYDKLLFDES